MSTGPAGLRGAAPCYRHPVRRTVAVVAGILASRAAYADDPHDLFGVGKSPATPPPPSCVEPHAFGCVTTADPLDDGSPYALATWLPASYLLRLPVADATHDAIAHYVLGASRDDTGVSFGGATGLENRWTIEGAPADSMRTGGVETRVPLTFLDGLTVTAGGFAARDRASTGGTIDVTLRRGGRTHVLEATVWGGLTAMGKVNERKAAKLYAAIDTSGFYKNPVDKVCRSWVNVPFTLPDAALDKAFLDQAKAAGLTNLKGHRVVGGMRASIYNAMPEAGVDALIAFMADFAKRHG